MSATVEVFSDEETWGWDFIRPGSDEGQLWFCDLGYDGTHGVVVAVVQAEGRDVGALEVLIAAVGDDLAFQDLPENVRAAVTAAGGRAE